MSAPITVPVAPPIEPATLQHLAPVTLHYLKALSTGERTLSEEQLDEIKTPPRELDQFLKYMSSTASSASSPAASIDLTYPMSDYFINSSHNTYLTGNQLYSESSTGAYKIALLRGCRCIEIDVWDGEPKSEIDSDGGKPHGIRSHMQISLDKFRHSKVDEVLLTQEQDESKAESLGMPKPWTSASTVTRAEPRVLHGYTLTKEVSFRDVCTAIKENAFVTSDLPVIVSLEVHTTAPQQEIMVEIIQSTFEGHLVTVPNNPPTALPSPAALRNKILIKVKYVDPKKAASKVSRTTQAAAPPPKSSLHHTSSTASSFSSASSNADDTPAPTSLSTPDQKKKKKKSAIIPSLSDLGIYTRSFHFSNLTSPDAHIPVHVFSLSEKKILEVHQSNAPTLFSHNRHFLMRVFPSGLRVRSDNLDPSIFWRKGVQMVALNWQRWDEGMMLNEGMFTGSKGWVLKPRGYLGSHHRDDSGTAGHKNSEESSSSSSSSKTEARSKPGEGSQADAITHKTLTLAITILAAQDIPLPLGNTNPIALRPYVKIELHVEKPAERTGGPLEGGGKSKDEGQYKQRTRTGKGTAVDFGGEQVHFRSVPGVVEELSFVRFKIQDDQIGKDELAAWACIRLDRLRSGYRFLHVLDAAGRESTGVVLVNIEKSLL